MTHQFLRVFVVIMEVASLQTLVSVTRITLEVTVTSQFAL